MSASASPVEPVSQARTRLLLGVLPDAAVYLASYLASYVNGESLVVDGGMTITQ